MVGFTKKTIKDVPIERKTVLLRTDFNVPLDDDGKVADDFRVRASLPTIRALLRGGCKVVIISHLGRPDGKRDLKYSLEPVADCLAKHLRRDVRFVADCVGPKVRMAVKRAPMNSVTVLENLRFYPEEEQNDCEFARRLAEDTGARYFVQDGFGVVHRAHASTAAITYYAPSVAGLLLEREVATITKTMRRPKHPLVALLGGAKVSDKIQIIEKFVGLADQIVIGGAMANTFLESQGKNLGKSKLENGQGAVIAEIHSAIRAKVGAKFIDNFLVLPTDAVIAPTPDSTDTKVVAIDDVPSDMMVLDIGPKSVERMHRALERAQTVIWNGTMGLAEHSQFATGSEAAAKYLADHPDTTSIIGGGDTADFVLHWDDKRGGSFTHVSTGGGASLELMAGKKLPGVEALLDA